MTRPLVSVITPAYNCENYIADCIDSVAHSVRCGDIDIEHIVADDGSTDDTVARIRAVESSPHPLHLIELGANTGKPSAVRNRAIAAASGEYIFCLDSDDVILQNTLRHLANHLERTRGRVAYGDFIRADNQLSYVVGQDYYGWPHPTPQAALHSIFRGDHFYQHSLLFTKSLWEHVGGYDEHITYGEDLDICIRFIMGGHLPQYLPITTHIHRNHPDSLTAIYEHKNSIWYAERRAHYRKYKLDLPRYLTAEQITDVEEQLQLHLART